MYSKELWILSPDTQTIYDTLSLDNITVEETREIGKPRQIKVSHPIREFPDDELERYLSIVRQGNKVWWPSTPDDDGCLYVINSEIIIDPLSNQITFYAEDVSVELSYLPPIELPTSFKDAFTHSKSSLWSVKLNSGSESLRSDGKLRLTANSSDTYMIGIPVSGSFTVSVTTKWVSGGYSADGGYRICTASDCNRGYHFVRNNSSGAAKITVSHNSGDGWTWLATVDSSFSDTVILRVNYSEGSTISFEYSKDAGATFTEVYSETAQGTPVSVCLKTWNACVMDFDDFTLVSPNGVKNTVDSAFVQSIVSSFFDVQSVSSCTAFLGGYYSPMSILREIEAQTGKEFQFTYEYNPSSGITRHLSLVDQIGDSVDIVLDPFEDFTEFRIVENETDYYRKAVPVFREEKDPKKFIDNLEAIKKYKELNISAGASIPSRVYELQDGKAYNGPSTPAPYAKPANNLAMYAGSGNADYQGIYDKNGSLISYKVGYVDSNEKNPYNLYWAVAEKLTAHKEPTIKVEGKLKASSLEDMGISLKVGDRVKVKLPWTTGLIDLRVEKTVRNTNDKGSYTVELGNREISAVNKWIGRFKPTISPAKLR